MSIYWFVALAAIAAETNVERTTVAVAPVPQPAPMVINIPTILGSPPKKGVESPPVPKSYPGSWASTRDYPSLALQEEREGTSSFLLKVSPKGVVTNCEITETSGHSDLDDATCTNVRLRATFYPAQDKRGKAISGSYANRVRWQIPILPSVASGPIVSDSFPRAPQPLNRTALRIEKEDYPASALAAGEQGLSTFMLDIDDGGKVRGCNILISSGSIALDQQACLVGSRWNFQPARNIDGRPTFGRTKHTLNWRLPKGTPRVSSGQKKPLFNPFEKPGSFTLTLDFDAQGKMVDCAIEQKGQFPFGGQTPSFMDNVCIEGFKRDIAPFLNADGKPEPRRVIFRMGIVHSDAVLPPPQK